MAITSTLYWKRPDKRSNSQEDGVVTGTVNAEFVEFLDTYLADIVLFTLF